MISRTQQTLVAIALLGTTLGPAQAQFVTPTSYSYTNAPETYIDNTGTQLTDGILGADLFSANLGNGAAYEWVGWQVANPTITFTFASTVNISEVQFGFNRNDFNSIYIPHVVTINGTANNMDTNALGVGAFRGFISVNQSITSNTVTINLSDTAGINSAQHWIFLDEVRFVQGSTAAPEPGTFALLALGGAVALVAKRRRK